MRPGVSSCSLQASLFRRRLLCAASLTRHRTTAPSAPRSCSGWLSASRSVPIHTAGGPVTANLHAIRLSIVPPSAAQPLFMVPQLLATELQHAAPNIDVLVGLNVLLECVF